MGRLVFRVWSFFISSTALWRLIEHTGICVFVGPNGSGKSLVMVEAQARAALKGIEWTCWDIEHRHHRMFMVHCDRCDTCSPITFLPHAVASDEELAELIDKGVVCATGAGIVVRAARGTRVTYSTVPLLESKGVPHPLYVPLTDYRQLLTIEHADVLFDEVAGIADSSESASMPVQVTNWQHKLRKADVRQRVTTPAYSRCAKPIRQVAQVVVEMRAFWPARSAGLLWRPRRIILATAYDAWAFDDFIGSEGQRDRLKPMARALLWVPDTAAIRHYNSLGQVLSLGHVTEGGMCVNCGGGRARPKCGCAHDYADVGPGDLEVVTVTAPNGTRTKRAQLRADEGKIRVGGLVVSLATGAAVLALCTAFPQLTGPIRAAVSVLFLIT